MLRFQSDLRPWSRKYPTTSIEFYREEFLKHQRCLEEQREYYSEVAINGAEQALDLILSHLDQLLRQRDAEKVVSRLLRQFDTVTGLSAWSDPKKAH
jgi:hypothetical protein